MSTKPECAVLVILCILLPYFLSSKEQSTPELGQAERGYLVSMRDYGGERNRPSESGRDAEAMIPATGHREVHAAKTRPTAV